MPPNILPRTSTQPPTTTTPGRPNYAGAIDPSAINNKGVQAVIAIICVGFVLTMIWFFFWAKNGGLQFRKGDWEEYKSTVLRRKGPNGTTLSNATKSTRLGGGSVVGQGYSDRDNSTYADETSTVYTGTMTELSTSTAPIIKNKNKEKEKYDDASTQYTGDNRQARRKARREREERAKERKQREMREADFENGHDGDVRAYMKEKPARVGGINITGDTLHYGTDYTDTESSIAASRGPGAPPSQPSTYAPAQSQPSTYAPSATSHTRRSSRNINIQHSPERREHRETRDHRESRRDFSYTIGAQQEREQFTSAPTRGGTTPPPVRVGPSSVNIQSSNTRAYHHPIPGLSPAAGRQGGGFRRGAGTDLDD